MASEDILVREGGRLSLGEIGRKKYGFKNFAELYAVFSAPRILTVMWGTKEVGNVEARFVQTTEFSKLNFILGARSWQAISIDWNKGVLHVEPVKRSLEAKWHGQPVLLGYELCQMIKTLLTETFEGDYWSKRTREKFAEIREYESYIDADGLTLSEDEKGPRLWTFGGGQANNLLARVFENKLGERVLADNFGLSFRDDAAKSLAAIRDTALELRDEGRPTQDDAVLFASLCTRGRISKFQPCLPEELESMYLAEVLTSPETARKALSDNITISLPAPPEEQDLSEEEKNFGKPKT